MKYYYQSNMEKCYIADSDIVDVICRKVENKKISAQNDENF